MLYDSNLDIDFGIDFMYCHASKCIFLILYFPIKLDSISYDLLETRFTKVYFEDFNAKNTYGFL